MVLSENDITPLLLTEKIHELYFTRQTFIDNMKKSSQGNAIDSIISLIEEQCGE